MEISFKVKQPVAKALLVAACGMTAACSSSPPKPAVVDGSDRQMLQDKGAVSAYAAYARQEADRVKASQTLKAAALQMQGHVPANAVEAQSMVERRRASKLIEAHGNNAVFRFKFAVNKSDLQVPPLMARSLVESASKASRIEIRGRTDSERDTKADRRISRERAEAAEQFLIENGIDASKIVVSAQASGGFRVDNSTPAGREENRRVEIELQDVHPSVAQRILLSNNR